MSLFSKYLLQLAVYQFIILIFGGGETYAQTIRQYPYLPLVGFGDSVMWDYRTLDVLQNNYLLTFDTLSASTQECHFTPGHYTTQTVDSVVELTQWEHPFGRLQCEQPFLLYKQRVGLHDTLVKNYNGTLQQHAVISQSISGKAKLTCDAQGLLYLPDALLSTRRQQIVYTPDENDYSVFTELCCWIPTGGSVPVLMTLCVKHPDGRTAFSTTLLQLPPDSVLQRISLPDSAWEKYGLDKREKTVKGEVDPWVKTYPNPSNSDVCLEVQVDGKAFAHMLLMDVSGRAVWSETQELHAGRNTLFIPFHSCASGHYILLLQWNSFQYQTILVRL